MKRFAISMCLGFLALAVNACGDPGDDPVRDAPAPIDNPELCSTVEQGGQLVLECPPAAFVPDPEDDAVSEYVSQSSHALSYVPCRTKTQDAAHACWCLYSARYGTNGWRVCAYQECPC
jgi:hypothetical protein